MHIYHDGTLPATRQRYHAAGLEVLRFGYWALQVWNHANLQSPYWRLYWNSDEGAEILLQGTHYPLGPDRVVLVTPNTPFTTRFNGLDDALPAENILMGCPAAEWPDASTPPGRIVHHFFVHFLVGAPFDAITPQVITIPVDAPTRRLLPPVLARASVDHQALSRQESFALQSLLHLALAHIPDDHWPSIPTDARVAAAMRYIDRQYAQRLTNADFAALASMNPKAFVRLFKEKTQYTPLAYLLRKRLEQASILLHHSNESIETIAERCGFCDRHHFSKAFQRTFGLGPAAYRRQRMP
jgi:AraC-like DNA-binding protein